MLEKVAPYYANAANLRENGYHVLPVMPGAKVPGKYNGNSWGPMPGWAKYCRSMPPDFVHEQWERWPNAGICVAHGMVIGLDLDTDRQDIAAALHAAIEPPTVARRGAKGWMGYYRPGEGLDGLTARVRWYDGAEKDASPVVELLLEGTQSVLPPTIHPDTGRPYVWTTPESLQDIAANDLPIFGGEQLAALDHEFESIGLTRKAPRRVTNREYERPAASDHDLEKPFGRSLNDRAMETSAIDQWWPALDMPKSRQRGVGAWEAVPWWRASGSGRAVQDRNPNLKATPMGIVDFGADRAYTPADVVMAAKDCSFQAAAEWLGQYVRPEEGSDVQSLNLEIPQCDKIDEETIQSAQPSFAMHWAPTPVFAGTRSFGEIKPVAIPSDAQWDQNVPRDPPPFPIQSFDDCEGLLGEVASHIDRASATATEAGALAVTLPLLGAAMGQAYETPSKLRTNIYSVALGGSGTGKTSLVSPAKEIMAKAQLSDLIGQDRIASGSGLLAMLLAGSRRVCFLDEFGHMLQQIGSSGSGAHAKQIVTEFTALYSAAWTLFTGTAYATREPTPIECPHFCLFGMATPDQFWRAFGSSSMEDGSIARYLIFPLGQTGAKDPDNGAAEATSEALKHVAATISQRPSAGNLGRISALRVPFDEYADKARRGLKEKESSFAEYAEINGVKGGPAILRRVTENASKIALISAVGRNASSPEIDQKDFNIGHALAWWSANTMISSIASHIADNQYERDVNEVEKFILDAGKKGRAYRDIQRRFRRVRGRDLKELLESLEKEGSVTSEIQQNLQGGHPVRRYRVSQRDRDT